jgi:DNA-binding LacI/PurR family transcriptional regulator
MTRPQTPQTPHRIALLFNANKVYDREIITGIGNYLLSTRVAWDLFLEEDFRCRLTGIERFDGDGIIADFDDPAVSEALRGCRLPVVAIGSSYEDETHYPPDLPYIATDNAKLVSLAYTHLIGAGLPHFALYSLPQAPENRWAQQRELAFAGLRAAEGRSAEEIDTEIYRGLSTSAPAWNQATEQLTGWLEKLPKPVGIIAVTDARARHLLQACLIAGIAVPEQVSIIGIDNDPLTRTLTRIPISSVIQYRGNGPYRRTLAASDVARRTLSGPAHPCAAGRHQRARIDPPPAAREPLCDARAALYPPVRLPGHPHRTGGRLRRRVALVAGRIFSARIAMYSASGDPASQARCGKGAASETRCIERGSRDPLRLHVLAVHVCGVSP